MTVNASGRSFAETVDDYQRWLQEGVPDLTWDSVAVIEHELYEHPQDPPAVPPTRLREGGREFEKRFEAILSQCGRGWLNLSAMTITRQGTLVIAIEWFAEPRIRRNPVSVNWCGFFEREK